MLVQLRGSLAVGLVAASLVLVDPAAAPALAVGEPIPPLTVPSSVVGSLDSATAAQRAAALSNVTTVAAEANIWKVPVTLGNVTKISAGATTASPLAVGAAGFMIGFEGTNVVMSMFGVPDDETGLDALWTAFGPKPADSFIPNSDVGTVPPPGWGGVPAGFIKWTACGAGTGCTGSPRTFQGFTLPSPTVLTAAGTPATYSSLSGTVVWPIALANPMGQRAYAQHWTTGDASGVAASVLVKCRQSDGAGHVVIGSCGNAGSAIPSDVVSAAGTVGGLTVGWGAFTGGSPSSAMGLERIDLVHGSQTIASWYPVGSPSRPADALTDPPRVWRTAWSCSSGPGGSLDSAPFRESDGSWPEFPAATCPGGAWPTQVTVFEVTTNGQVETAVIASWTPQAPLLDWQTKYPQCVSGACQLLLERIDPATSARTSCFDNPGACVDWMNDPLRADKYACTYGGTVVDLEECSAYRQTFNKAAGTSIQQGTQTVPATSLGDYSDPKNGDVVTVPGGSVDPDSGTGQQGCPPPFEFTAGGIGYWVTKGVMCALDAAFVPTKSQSRIQEVVDLAGTKTPFPQLRSIVTALSPPEGGTECFTLTLPIAFVIGHDQAMLDTCNSADPVAKLLRDNRTVLGIVVWVATISPLAWWAWKQYAPGASGAA